MQRERKAWARPTLSSFGNVRDVVLMPTGGGKYPGPGDGQSTPNVDACPPGHYRQGLCS